MAVEKLIVKKQACPRTLVYCKTTKECGQLFSFFKMELKENAYVSSDHKSDNMLPTAEAVSAFGRQVPPHARKTSGTQGRQVTEHTWKRIKI